MKLRVTATGQTSRRLRRIAFVVFSFLVPIVLTLTAGTNSDPKPEKRFMNIQLNSSSFAEGKEIPAVHTCQGKDASPPLKWSGVPANARSLAVIADDPDAPVGTWVHWVLYDLPPTTTELAENVERSQYLPGGAKQGLNDFQRLGYGGPCPPPGKPHRYYFKIYALDLVTGLKPGATKQQLLKAMEGHVIAEGQLMGTYQRR